RGRCAPRSGTRPSGTASPPHPRAVARQWKAPRGRSSGSSRVAGGPGGSGGASEPSTWRIDWRPASTITRGRGGGSEGGTRHDAASRDGGAVTGSTSASDVAAAARGWQAAAPRLASVLASGAGQSAILGFFMVAAGALDYAVNVIAGRWLEPVDFGVFVSITALTQILLAVSMAIRIVVASCTAQRAVPGAPAGQVATFVSGAWRWSWRWGLVA